MAKHSLVTGVTQSGKTTLARYYSRALLKAKQRVVVYDPLGTSTLGGNWGEGAEIYDDPFLFLQDMENGAKISNCHVFIDEADEIFSQEQKENFWILKKGRHYGLSVWVITQRPKMVAPTVRNQCADAYLFRLAIQDVKEIAADFGHSNIHTLELEHGDYIVLHSGYPQYERGSIHSLPSPQTEKVTK